MNIKVIKELAAQFYRELVKFKIEYLRNGVKELHANGLRSLSFHQDMNL